MRLKLPEIVSQLGKRAFVVTGNSPQRYRDLLASVETRGVSTVLFQVSYEPTIELTEKALLRAREEQCSVVIGIGGGSVIDTAKAVAALLANPGALLDYLEVVGQGKALANPSLPCIAVPTTAGTGAEVTRNAVIAVPERGAKVSFRSSFMFPAVALVDPELTIGVPQSVTAASGMDALTQLIEPLVSNAPTPITDNLCREGLLRCARSLRAAIKDGTNLRARENMSLAALLSGMTLTNSRLGAVHALAGVIGARVNAAHGALCAVLLAPVIEANLNALRSRIADSPALDRYQQAAAILTGSSAAKPEDAIAWVKETCAIGSIPALKTYGISTDDFSAIIGQARKANSVKGNPIELTNTELGSVLSAAYT